MATSLASEESNLIEKIYEHKGKFYKVIENTEFHTSLQSNPSLMEIYFDDCTRIEESVNLTSIENEMTDANKENLYWNNKNTKLLLHLFQERKGKFRDPKIKKKTLWTEIVNEFKKHNYKNVTEDILDRKMRNMKKTYRTIKDNQKLTGRGRITWEYFDIFEDIFIDDKTINFGPTLSSMQCTLQPHDSEEMTKQGTLVSSDNCNLIRVPKDGKTSQCNFSSLSKELTSSTASFEKCITPSLLSKEPRPLSSCSISPSRHSRISSTDSRSSCDTYDLISVTEEEHNSQLSINIEDPHEDKDDKCIPPRHKPYSMKDGAVRSRALYERRRKNETTEKQHVKEITELRKVFEKNNEIQENRNKLLQDLLEELKTSKK